MERTFSNHKFDPISFCQTFNWYASMARLYLQSNFRKDSFQFSLLHNIYILVTAETHLFCFQNFSAKATKTKFSGLSFRLSSISAFWWHHSAASAVSQYHNVNNMEAWKNGIIQFLTSLSVASISKRALFSLTKVNEKHMKKAWNELGASNRLSSLVWSQAVMRRTTTSQKWTIHRIEQVFWAMSSPNPMASPINPTSTYQNRFRLSWRKVLCPGTRKTSLNK